MPGATISAFGDGRRAEALAETVYGTLSLCLKCQDLDYYSFVNLEPNLRPTDLVSIEGEIPEALEVFRLELKSLSPRWHETRDESLRTFGDEWVHKGRTAAMLVPSAAVRGEWNVLLNPAHPQYPKIRFLRPRPFEFDTRMFS